MRNVLDEGLGYQRMAAPMARGVLADGEPAGVLRSLSMAIYKRWFSSRVMGLRITGDGEEWVSVKVRLAGLFLVAASLFLMAAPLWARSHSHPARAEVASGPGYGLALAEANHFLHAWQTGDVENGMVQLSDGIRHAQNAEQLEQFFSDGTDRAFEIGRGRGHAGLYSFPVVLVTLRGGRVTRKASEITLVESGKNDWVVDKLP